MKRLIAATLLVSSLLMIASCGRKSEDELRLQAYYDALDTIYDTRECPDGYVFENFSQEALINNDYAIYDVDTDGVDELVVRCNVGSLAGQCARVYEYYPSVDSWACELDCQPDVHFFDNGMVMANSIRNQSRGLMCPYYIYHYNAAEDYYPGGYYIWSWDLIDGEEGYPYEIDYLNAGSVYYINYYARDISYSFGDAMCISKTDYEVFYNEQFGNSIEVDVGFMPWGEGLPN